MRGEAAGGMLFCALRRNYFIARRRNTFSSYFKESKILKIKTQTYVAGLQNRDVAARREGSGPASEKRPRPVFLSTGSLSSAARLTVTCVLRTSAKQP